MVKLNTCFWRGTTTGSLFRDDMLLSVEEYEKHLRPNRIQLVTQYFQKSPKIDVSFSFLHRPYLIPKYGKYVKGYVSIPFFKTQVFNFSRKMIKINWITMEIEFQ